jgi:DNA-binding NarL/FixJ family response regulator
LDGGSGAGCHEPRPIHFLSGSITPLHAASAAAPAEKTAITTLGTGSSVWLIQGKPPGLRCDAHPVLEQLTEKERRVAELVVRGRTNHEVAERLHLSHKTVEWTLTKVYKKLNVRSRTELTAKLFAAEVRGFPRPDRATLGSESEEERGKKP